MLTRKSRCSCTTEAGGASCSARACPSHAFSCLKQDEQDEQDGQDEQDEAANDEKVWKT